jgi:hypothetical protein
MFCDGCGAALQSDQAFCSRCGKEVKSGMHVAGPRRSRLQEHVRLLGILWLAMGAVNVIGAMVLYILSRTIFGGHFIPPGEADVPANFLHNLMAFLAIAVLVKAAAGVAAGWGLLQRESWARLIALILGFIALLSVPLGTALGIYTLWVLLPAESEREYEEQSRAALQPAS